jgi:O-antigen ligase
VISEPWFLVAALPAAVALGAWAVLDLQRFVYILIPASMISPAALASPGGAIVALADVLTVVAVGAWVVVAAVRRRPDPWVRSNPLVVPSVIFVGWNAASLAWSITPSETVKLTIQLTEIVLITTLLFASVPERAAVIRAGFATFVTAAFVLSVITLITSARNLGSDLEALELPGGLNKNVVGSFIGVGVAMLYVLRFEDRQISRRWTVTAVGAVMFLALIATFSRGSVLGVLVAILVGSAVLRKGRLPTTCVVAAIAAAYLIVIGPDSRVNPNESGSYDSSIVRVETFRDARERIASRPLLGEGAGTYDVYIPELEIGLRDPNNMFLLTWCELGIIGLSLLLWLLARAGATLARARRLGHAERHLAVAAGCGAISLLVHFQVDVTWTRGTASLAFALLGAMSALMRISAVERPAIADMPRPREYSHA